MAYQKISNQQVRPTIIRIMGNMPVQDRASAKKVELALKAEGYKPPTAMTLAKAQAAFFASNAIGTNGNTPTGLTGLNNTNSISLHDLAELLTHKDLINRIGPDAIKQIAEKW